ncbi:hypothetical protein ACWEH1_06940 [Micromonospora chersina]
MHNEQALWLSIIVMFGLLCAAGGGFVSWLISRSAGRAILTGASTFAGAVLLMLAMAAFVGISPNNGGRPAEAPSIGQSPARRS